MAFALALAIAAGGQAFAAPDAAGQTAAAGVAQPGTGIKRQPPHYVGTVYCYACHQELALEFARTKMGKLFLVKPQNDLERRGCEGCHGPASDHAESGGGLGVGGMAEFRIDHGQSIERNNRACLECHDEAFWHGKTHGLRRMACFDCHVVMVRMSSHLPARARAPPAKTGIAGVPGATQRWWVCLREQRSADGGGLGCAAPQRLSGGER